jgi:hypothetical protein
MATVHRTATTLHSSKSTGHPGGAGGAPAGTGISSGAAMAEDECAGGVVRESEKASAMIGSTNADPFKTLGTVETVGAGGAGGRCCGR